MSLLSKFKQHKLIYLVNCIYKASLVERKISREFEYYTKKRNMSTSVQQKKINHLGKRLSNLAGKSQPLNIVYVSAPTNWEVHNIPPSLAKVGNLITYYYRERGFNDLATDWPQKRHLLDKDLIDFICKIQRTNPIDIFIGYLSGWQISPETIRAIGDLGAITVGFCWDDKPAFRGKWVGGRWSGPAALASAFDLNLTNAPSSIIKYETEGGRAVFWPEAANQDHFKPLGNPFEYDVSFVGACYGYRPILIEFLRKNGVKVEVFGPGWPSGSLAEDEMVKIYSKSRINLGFGGIGYSMKAQCLKGRDFEVPMCGAVYLTTDNPELGLVYDIGTEVVTYRDKNDCLKKIKELLADPKRCENIRKSARLRCLTDHTWDARFRTLLDLCSSAEYCLKEFDDESSW